MTTRQTQQAVMTLLNYDPMATQEDKDRIESIMCGDKEEAPRLMSRREVADLIGKTPEMVDTYARGGFLKRVYLGNSSRASGFDVESVKAFIAGRQNGKEAC